jgi:hypothetical protein
MDSLYAYTAILTEANGAVPDATPGVNPDALQYATIGAAIGAAATDADNLHLLNDLLAAQSVAGVSTVSGIDNLARIANALQLVAAGQTANPALTAADFSQIGIADVNDTNLPLMLAAIAAQTDDG